MELIGFKDAHIADKGPKSRIDDYRNAILKKIHFIGKLAANRGASAILEAGDLLHSKNPHNVTHLLVRDLTEMFKSFSCPVLSVYGNHEMPQLNLEDAMRRHPKSVLFTSGSLTHPTERGYVLRDAEVQVRVVGFDYDHAEHDVDVPWFNRVYREPEDDWVICIAHSYASPRGGTMPDGTPKWDYRKMVGSKADLFFFGHEHMDQGIEEIGGKFFVNNGALSRGALTEDNVTRDVNVFRLVVAKDGLTPSLVRVPCAQNASEVFDFSSKAKKSDTKEVVDFISTLSQSKPIDLEKLIDEAPYSDHVKKKVRELLTQ